MHTHTDLKTRKGWSREVHTYTLETQKGHTAILFRLPVPQFLHQSNRLMMGVFHINEKRLIRWCWQSHVEFPGQKRSIVETCQMCHVSCKESRRTSNAQGMKTLRWKHILESEGFIWNEDHTWVGHVYNCPISYSLTSNYRMGAKGPA